LSRIVAVPGPREKREDMEGYKKARVGLRACRNLKGLPKEDGEMGTSGVEESWSATAEDSCLQNKLVERTFPGRQNLVGIVSWRGRLAELRKNAS